ncbi:glypican-2 [Crotalus adamanteus]|uniref:Glypican-2 n=1 Tax=Crotalus adamanteus TaxID=8729 RepID=A0AAW1B957_CROAD
MGTPLLLSALGALLYPQALASRGFSLASVPPTLISGEHLRICPQDYICCASETEERLSEQGQADLRALLGEPGAFLIHTLSSRQRRFQDFFQELLAGAERSLQAMFARSYGRLYMQHARLFQGLFVELHRHLKGSRPGLDEALSDFWSQLLERMLPLLNPQKGIWSVWGTRWKASMPLETAPASSGAGVSGFPRCSGLCSGPGHWAGHRCPGS